MSNHRISKCAKIAHLGLKSIATLCFSLFVHYIRSIIKQPLMYNYHILAIDDNEALLQTLKLILKKEFAMVGTVSRPNLAPAILAGGNVDAILLDMNFDKGRLDCEEGLYWLNAIKERPNPPAIILMTAFGDIDIAVRAMKQGADDFVTKPWDNRELIAKIVAAIEKRQNNANQQKEEEESTSTLKEIEEERLRKVLKETGRNITKSAEILGISRRTLYNKIEKYGL